MTAVRPLSRINIMTKSTRLSRRRPRRRVSVDAANSVVSDVTEPKQHSEEVHSEEAGFCGEPFADDGEMLSNLSPLLFSMKLCGMYFQRGDRNRRRADDPEWSNPAAATAAAATTPGASSTRLLRAYATVVLILVWLNAVRFASVFSRSDRFGAILFMKMTVFTWIGLTALMQTAYYHANHTGQLLKILRKLPVTRDCVRGAGRYATVLTAFTWTVLVVDLSLGAYFFAKSNADHDFILAPFVTHIPVSDDAIKIARIFGYLGYASVFPGIFFAHAMTTMMVYIFYSQFKKVKKNFRRALLEGGQFGGNLSLFRLRHPLINLTWLNIAELIRQRDTYRNISPHSVDVTRRSVARSARWTAS